MYFIRKETKKTYFRVRFELVTRGFELVTLIPELLTRNSQLVFYVFTKYVLLLD